MTNDESAAASTTRSRDPSAAGPRQRVLLLPGWQDSGPTHWQSRWEALHGYQRVEQDDWLWPRRGDWMARLDEVMQGDDTPVVLVAHSLGCHLVAAWAAHSQHTARVRAALLVAPPDTERDDTPPNLYNWRPIVRQRLPFASLVVASSDDPYCSIARAAGLAADWGSAWCLLGAHGHINGESQLGDWDAGRALLQSLK
ncbi:MAG: alpha/beta hydrolase [Burkholderiaceae bacterium]|nr:alpha/beta hydrolase [Burkholderiaceae bacterium]